MATTFSKVWYRSGPLGGGELTMKAMQDTGTLTVEPGEITFVGKKSGTVELRDLKRVTAGRAGRDLVNRWVTVEHGDGQVAMFVDGGMLGWRGILGGNKKLRAAVEAAVPGQEGAP